MISSIYSPLLSSLPKHIHPKGYKCFKGFRLSFSVPTVIVQVVFLSLSNKISSRFVLCQLILHITLQSPSKQKNIKICHSTSLLKILPFIGAFIKLPLTEAHNALQAQTLGRP